MHPNIVVLIGLMAVIPMAPSMATAYTFQPINAPNVVNMPSTTFVTGINNAGQVVGNTYGYQPSDSFFDLTPSIVNQGFVYNVASGAFSIINDPNGVPFHITNPSSIDSTIASGINDAGQVIGSSQNGSNYIFDTTTGILTSVNYSIGAGQAGLTLVAINNTGLTAGTGPNSPGFATYSVGGTVDLSTGRFTPLNDPGAPTPGSLIVTGVNNLGQVIGYTYPGIPSGGLIGQHSFVVIPQGFIFDTITGLYTNLPAPNGTSGFFAESLNDVGQAVGYANDGRGYVLDLATGTFTSLVDPVSNAFGTELTGINDAGDIVGWYQINTHTGGYAGFIAIPQTSSIPEPATLAILGAGIFGLALTRRWIT